MADVVTRNSYRMASGAGVSEVDCKRIRGAFVYGGFGYDLTVRNATALNDGPAEVQQRDDDSSPFR